jgi:hypothetical protein
LTYDCNNERGVKQKAMVIANLINYTLCHAKNFGLSIF